LKTKINNPTILEINAKAIAYNVAFFKSKLKSNTKILVVVKAFSYGSDAIILSKILEKEPVDYLAVAYTDEGVALKKAGITLPILVLHPQINNFKTIIEYGLEPNLYNFNNLNAFLEIVKSEKKAKYPIHLKFNTGLNRLGFNEFNTLDVITLLKDNQLVKIISVFSHLGASEDLSEKKYTENQITVFNNIQRGFLKNFSKKITFHLSNTSGILNYPEAQFDMVRLGIGTYGFANEQSITNTLKNVLSLKTIISQIHYLEKGDSLGYNRHFKATKPTKTATLPIGYADGISRLLGNSVGSVKINNQKAPIIGTVCMDMIMVDVTNIDCNEGDEVIVFNSQNDILNMAKNIHTISYEIITNISQRVKRVVV
jgi:alanine racemase